MFEVIENRNYNYVIINIFRFLSFFLFECFCFLYILLRLQLGIYLGFVFYTVPLGGCLLMWRIVVQTKKKTLNDNRKGFHSSMRNCNGGDDSVQINVSGHWPGCPNEHPFLSCTKDLNQGA